MVEKIETLKSQYAVPAVSLADLAGIAKSSYLRWKQRIYKGEDPVKKPAY